LSNTLDKSTGFADIKYKSNSKEGVSSMEHFNSFTMSTISHHSFMRWSKMKTVNEQKERETARFFDPTSLDEDSMERDLMITAFSA
ncbi:MAG: hypothetical protein ACQETH_15495, partial [Candidatus Rifleibacteriota bacterium]